MSADFPCWRVRRPNVESGTLHIHTVSEQEIEKNLPELPPHMEDGFSLKQLEILHDYAVEAFTAGIAYANKHSKGIER